MSDSPPVTRTEIFGWSMFDFANSSYTTVVITAVYAPFFVSTIVPEGWGSRDSWWSLAIIISTLISLVMSPIVGAICDYSGRKKTWLVASAIICAIATALLALVGPGQVWLAIMLIVISNAGFMLSETFCGAFLPEISTPKTIGLISGLGWGIGYFGGLASLVLTRLVIINASAEQALYVPQHQLAMLATGAFFLVAALPTFLLVRNRAKPRPGFETASLPRLARAGIKELRQSVTASANNRVLFRFLGAFMIYMAGLDAVIKFVGIYATEVVQLTDTQFITLFLILQISAAAGAVGFGALESRLGPRNSVLLSLCLWVAAVLSIYNLPTIAGAVGTTPQNVFFAIGVAAGAGIGSTQSASRTIVGLLAHPGQTAQAFGLWSMFTRMAMILGAGFGFASDRFGREQAILLLLAYFVLGGLLLLGVDIKGELKRRERDDDQSPLPASPAA